MLCPLTGVAQSSATTGQVPKWSGAAWVPTTLTGSGTLTSANFLRITSAGNPRIMQLALRLVW